MNNSEIIDEMGMLFEDFGVNPILGRIYGILLCSDEPKSLIEISDTLSLSKAAVSIQIRVLEQFGYCRKIPYGKKRQHYYVLKENYLEAVYKKRLEKEKAYLETFRELEDGQKDIPDFVKKRIREFTEFSNHMIANQTRALSEWHGRKKDEN